MTAPNDGGPATRYTAGYAAGVEAAAEWCDAQANLYAAYAGGGRGDVKLMQDRELSFRDAATAIRALAPPPGDVVVGRLRWEIREAGRAAHLFIGRFRLGFTFSAPSVGWSVFTETPATDNYVGIFDTLAAAQAALVAAVREEMEAPHD